MELRGDAPSFQSGSGHGSVIPAKCEGILLARIDSTLEVENGLVEPSPQVHPPEAIYIATTLVQDRREVPVRVLDATHRDQKLTNRSPLAHCETVTLVTSPDLEQPQARDPSSKLQDIPDAARPPLSNGEFQDLEELLAVYEDIFAVGSEDYGRTNKVYHRIDTGDARPIRQPLRRQPLANKRR
jgi:hypothetical protein